jgi:hypothetical protein
MATRIQIQPRRRRTAGAPLADMTATSFDETALLDAADGVIESIDEVIEG